MSAPLRIRCLDFETTGFPPKAAVVELGWTDVLLSEAGEILSIEPTEAMFVDPWRGNPDLVMSPQAQEVHGISREMVCGAPPPDVGFKRLAEGADVFLAHNCQFEQAFFSGGEKPWICTLKVARRCLPYQATHKLQDLIRALPVEIPDRDFAAQAHRAGPDTYVNARLFAFFLSEHGTAREMIDWTAGAAPLLKVIPIGKHKGTPFEEVPSSYLFWVVGNVGDKEVVRAARHHLKIRRNGKVA